MRYLTGEEARIAEMCLRKAAEVALRATCLRSKCGAVIIKDDEILGKGFNSPPGNDEAQRRCHLSKDSHHKKVTDKTCCVHAEQRAVMDALDKHNSEKIKGSRLYFIRLDKEGKLTRAGKPYCTICSKSILDVGIEEFVLWHDEGIAVYKTDEYNNLSYMFKG
ncbi:hypothetical protein GOV03_04645 [Candidatus Woesearchaeota archaeon]|nr:hypothetical protein [Candidatus Woesearchaeota archaeon]